MQMTEFLPVMEHMIPRWQLTLISARHAPRARTPRKLSTEQLISGLVFHQLQPSGTLAAHCGTLHGIRVSDSALTQRREKLPVELFETLMDCALEPLAEPARQPESFYEGYRLVGIDGTQWSVSNTPAILEQLPKAASRRLQAAFAKLRLVSAVELGTHAPIAALAAPVSKSEQALAAELWGKIPERSLIVTDRLFGTPLTLYQAQCAFGERDIAFLVRVRENIRAEIVEDLPDGSALIEVPVKENRQLIACQRWREIRACGIGRDGQRFALRLWTSLLDARRHPAETLARRYIERWEQELYFRELKLDVRSSPLLASHTVETALQEIAALVLASAVIARLRLEAAGQLKVPPSRMSFLKLMHATQSLWEALAIMEAVMGEPLTPEQCRRAFERYIETVRYAILPERRARSCPRAIRKPVSGWPRKTTQRSYTGEVQINIVRV